MQNFQKEANLPFSLDTQKQVSFSFRGLRHLTH